MVRVVRPDDAIAIGVEVGAVLLQDGLVAVIACPAAVLGAIRALERGCNVGAGST